MNHEVKNNNSIADHPAPKAASGESGEIICAVSTPPGTGGIAIVRLSGEGSIAMADSVFRSPAGKKLSEQKAYTLHFGQIIENENVLDEVLVSIFHAPHSFTGEECIEISCHGSIYIQQELVKLLLSKGARLALAGEFTRRAFRNGKMDLSQAEAVADVIAATSQAAHRLSMNQMRGGFAKELNVLRDQLLQFASLIELELDFSEEDVAFANRRHLSDLAQEIESVLSRLTSSFGVGNAIKNGIPVAIIGETNAGKSTLLNLLLHEDKAIVSDIHGTTRDVIEDTININGVMFRFIDTAGIRETSDAIESMGIRRTFDKIQQASIVLWLIDLSTPDRQIKKLSKSIIPSLKGKHTILVFNKSDKLSPEEIAAKQHLLPDLEAERIFISAKQRRNTDKIQDLLLNAAQIPQVGNEDVIVTNLRHYEALNQALTSIHRIQEGLYKGISHDFLAQDIRECMFYIGEITGQISTNE
ncbi:MAG: tRNA uridine-5-carboxymethylaminomethyl(34) synthesis GTPase MnmE, partial [Dysgonamonadaceae bacterium]|nr:tRNA uridine-5-carboxymethylaminomethyl(34) synthesis GTPase MnmE [Dysgonamonadaceae bacterium]